MSYARVIPRDLFNEANLLKCYGKLSLAYVDKILPEGCRIIDNSSDGFDIQMDQSDGSLYIANIALHSSYCGHILLKRPMNSREPWPLVAVYVNDRGVDEEMDVFNHDGSFNQSFLNLLKP